MNDSRRTDDQASLDSQVNRAAFYSAVVLFVAAVPALFLPLDAPEGPFADRMIWFSSNLGMFVAGWVVQMILMLTLRQQRSAGTGCSTTFSLSAC